MRIGDYNNYKNLVTIQISRVQLGSSVFVHITSKNTTLFDII